MQKITLNPELTFAALGALAGVILTVTTQSLTSYFQRRSDRILKTYEIKLDLFVDFLMAIDGVSGAVRHLNKMDEDPELQKFLTAKIGANKTQSIVEDIERQLKSDPPPTPEVASAIRARAREEFELAQERIDLMTKMLPQMSTMAKDLAEQQEKLKVSQEVIARLGFKLRLVADDNKIAESISQFVKQINAREEINQTDYRNFISAAAKRLGIK